MSQNKQTKKVTKDAIFLKIKIKNSNQQNILFGLKKRRRKYMN